MTRVLFPLEASTFCALGMIVTNVQHDYAVSQHQTSLDFDGSALDAMFAELEQTARERLREDGFSDDRIELRRSVDARYPGQVHDKAHNLGSVGRSL